MLWATLAMANPVTCEKQTAYAYANSTRYYLQGVPCERLDAAEFLVDEHGARVVWSVGLKEGTAGWVVYLSGYRENTFLYATGHALRTEAEVEAIRRRGMAAMPKPKPAPSAAVHLELPQGAQFWCADLRVTDGDIPARFPVHRLPQSCSAAWNGQQTEIVVTGAGTVTCNAIGALKCQFRAE